MLTTSTDYKSIFANPAHGVEWRITVNGTVYDGDRIAGVQRPQLGRRLLVGDEPTTGNCIAGTFQCAICEASSAVPRMAAVVAQYRLFLPPPEGQAQPSDVSEWITLGTFFIDTRQVDKASGALILSCFDRMLVAAGAGGATYAQLTAFDQWPQSQAAVAADIAAIMEISLDPRSLIGAGAGYMVEYPNDLSCLEVLSNIGVANAGNWCITPANALRLVPLTGGTDSFVLGASAMGLRTSPALQAWSGVTVYYGDEQAYEAGDDTGRRMTCDCPWATQATADGILAALSGSAYQPYSADGAHIDMSLELGDIVTVGAGTDTVSGPVFVINITGGGMEQASISAPGDAEIDHEYPYTSYVDRSLKRKVGLNTPYYGVTISRQKGLEIKRSDGLSEALFNSDVFAMRALIDGVMDDRLYFDVERGDYVFKGALGVDSLYADLGDIAELTVDRLSTSKRIRLYILGNTADDNYIKIQDNYMRLITGSVRYADNEPLEVQAANRWGEGLYWKAQPVSHTQDGYPLDENGKQIYSTTEVTDWPVMVYEYTEQIKAQLQFELEGNTYVPKLIMGAGDGQGRTKGILHKAADGFDIMFEDTHGDEQGLRMNSAGYMDLYGIRKPTEIDLSGWSSGYFSQTLDGGQTCTYLVDFDSGGNPIRITDGDGHVTEVLW